MVKKQYGFPGGPTSPIVRLCDAPTGVGEQEPTTARGRRRSNNTPEYQANLATRMKQTAPAAPARKAHKGPTSRPSGWSSDQWRDKMLKKSEWD